MVRPKSSGRCVGVQRCSKILYEMLSRKLVLAVQKAASASIYNRQTTLAELTTAQSVVLAIMNSLVTEDLEFCIMLLKLYSSVEQLRSSYLTVWLRDDFEFPEEDVSKLLMTVAHLVNGGALDMPDHVQRVFRGLAAKYHVLEKCRQEKDFETMKFLEEESEIINRNEDVTKDSTDTERAIGHTKTPKIVVDSGEVKTTYSGELPKKFVFKNINFKEVAEQTKNYSIAKSSSDTNILSRGTKNRRKATLSMFIDEKEETASVDLSGIQHKSGLVADISQRPGIHSTRLRKLSIDRYRNTVAKKEENTVPQISHSGKMSEVTAENKYSYNISKSSSAMNLRSNITDIINDKSGVKDKVAVDNQPLYSVYKSSSARCIPSHISEKNTSIPSDPISLFSGIMEYQTEGVQALIDNRQVEAHTNNIRTYNNDGVNKSEKIISSMFEGVQSLMVNSALPSLSSIVKSVLQFNTTKGLINQLITTQRPTVRSVEEEEDDEENFYDCSTWMSIHEAAWNGGLKDLNELLDKGLDIESEDDLGRKPLHQASSNGQVEAVSLLLGRGANPSAVDRQHKSPLHLSSRNGHIEACKILLQNGADVNHRDCIGRNALHHAVDGASKEVITLLTTFGADVNAEDNHGWTPLHRASETGRVDVADVLLTHQANVIARDKSGRTPLHLAADRGRLEVVELLLEQNSQEVVKDLWGKTALHLAASSGQSDVVKALLDRAFDAEVKDNSGLTALHEAIEGGHVELVRYLISRSNIVSPVDIYGRTPLHRAVGTNQLAVVEVLLEVGADVAVKDFLSQTPLHFAAKSSNKEIASVLIEHGADITLTDSRHKTPLHVATINGNMDIVRLLIDRGAKLNVQDKLGRTPLHEAVAYGHLDVIRTLISCGADIEDVDDLWKTSLHLATTRGNLDIVKLLVKSGACVNSRSLLEATPLASALLDGETAITKFLRVVGGTE